MLSATCFHLSAAERSLLLINASIAVAAGRTLGDRLQLLIVKTAVNNHFRHTGFQATKSIDILRMTLLMRIPVVKLKNAVQNRQPLFVQSAQDLLAALNNHRVLATTSLS